jgi:heme oxygenase
MSSSLTTDASIGTVADAMLPLSQRLKAETAKLHDMLDQLVMSTKPFDNRENYGRFVLTQYLFQRDIESLYDDARLQALIPDLPSRPRLAAAALDLQDLGVVVPDDAGAPAAARLDIDEGLGWLYVSEGSKLGAAFLFKEAAARLGLSETVGARNLAAPEGGRGAQWKRFVHVLDHNDLSPHEQDRVVEGARQAFHRFAELLRRSFRLAA